VWDLKDLGMQAAQRILESGEPLHLLTELAGSFPAHAGPLSRLEVAPESRTEWAMNRRILQVKLQCTYVLVS
jgi:UDP-glucose:glycoprotein glucosyltransferase